MDNIKPGVIHSNFRLHNDCELYYKQLQVQKCVSCHILSSFSDGVENVFAYVNMKDGEKI